MYIIYISYVSYTSYKYIYIITPRFWLATSPRFSCVWRKGAAGSAKVQQCPASVATTWWVILDSHRMSKASHRDGHSFQFSWPIDPIVIYVKNCHSEVTLLGLSLRRSLFSSHGLRVCQKNGSRPGPWPFLQNFGFRGT